MTIRQIEWGSSDYGRALVLRNDILSAPLGSTVFKRDLREEEAYLHYAAIADDGEVVGTLMLRPESDEQVHMQQVATSEKIRGTGIGRELVAFAHEDARKRGYKRIELDSREGAMRFYAHMGYKVCGETRWPRPDLPLTPMCREL